MQIERPVLSTVILNWNRSDLLRVTIDSYLETVSKPFELIIADNASSDDSRSVIEAYAAKFPNVKTLLLDENLGGEAINRGLSLCCGDLLHISENDIQYLPGWADEVFDLFETFHQLGQLSLFGPSPTDDLVMGTPQSTLRHSKGRIVYEARHNLTTTCVIRKSIWEKGIRMGSYGTNYRFPDDGKFSGDIKKAGYMVAWADHFLVRNMGHDADEMKKRESYYLENYKSKPWMGQSGMEKVVREWQERPKPIRSSFVLDEERISAERTLAGKECLNPLLWSMVDGRTPEVETLEFLFSLVRIVKPGLVLETSSWQGHASCAMGKALRSNGKGKLVSIESDAECFEVARKRVIQKGLEQYVQVLNESSLAYSPSQKIDLLLSNSEPGIREEEFDHFLPKLEPGAVVVFQDTAHKACKRHLARLLKEGILEGFFLPTPRGIGLFRFGNGKGSESLFNRLRSLFFRS